MRPAIECRAITKSFADGRGVFDLTLTVPAATAYALVGANGAGKTTLINLCLGFLQPDAGSITIGDVEVARDPIAAKSRLAYVPEVARLYSHLTALQNMRMFEGILGRERSRDELLAPLRQLDFPVASADDAVGTYSKGMRQKLAIALGLLKGASVFILDEPTSGLDPRSAVEFHRVLDTLRAEGKSILFSSHDLHNIHATAGRVGMLHRGRLVLEESAAEFCARDMAALYGELEAHA